MSTELHLGKPFSMKHYYLQVADKLHLQATGPLTGGGTGLFLWAQQIAPFVSIVAAIIGIILGLLTFILKWQDRTERKYKSLYLLEKERNLIGAQNDHTRKN